MEKGHISRDDARRIGAEIKKSGVFIGTEEWFESSGVSAEEYQAFFDCAERMAASLDWLDAHRKDGMQIRDTRATLKQIQVTDKATKLVFELSFERAGDIPALSSLVGQTLDVELFPEQMPLPIADDVPEGQTALEE